MRVIFLVTCSSTRWKVEELSSPGRSNRPSKGTCSQRRNVGKLEVLYRLYGRTFQGARLGCKHLAKDVIVWSNFWPHPGLAKVASPSRNKPATSNSIYYLNNTLSPSLLPPLVLFSTPFLHCSLRPPLASRPQHSTFLNFGLAVVSLTQFSKNGSVSHTEFTLR